MGKKILIFFFILLCIGTFSLLKLQKKPKTKLFSTNSKCRKNNYCLFKHLLNGGPKSQNGSWFRAEFERDLFENWKKKKMEFWRIGAWSIVKNNTCKECPEFLPLTSVWLIQTSLHTLNNLSLIFYLHTNHSPEKNLQFFFFFLDFYLISSKYLHFFIPLHSKDEAK